MRAALITLAADGMPCAEVAGRSLALHQLEFSLAAGCELVILLGNGASDEALTLRHAAERAGAKFRALTNPRGLPALLAPSDDLLVLQSNLLPAARQVLTTLGKDQPRIFMLPGEVARPGGFERIDLGRAWAGAMLLPAGLTDSLHALDADFDTSSTLLRLALQYGVKDESLPATLLDSGEWAAVTPERAEDLSRGWIARHIPAAPRFSPSKWFARAAVKLGAMRFARKEKSATVLAIVTALLTIGGVGLAAVGFAWAGFAAQAVAAVAAQATILSQRLRAAPFGAPGRVDLVALLPDLGLLACGVLALDGPWPQRVFPPLILFIGLRLIPYSHEPGWQRLLRDRGLIAALLALAAGLGFAGDAVMIAALAALVPGMMILGRNRS